MDNEIYIIKRTPWEYSDSTGEYLDDQGTFTRDLKKVKVFNNLNDVSDYRRNLVLSDYYRKHIYQIIEL